MKSCLKIPFGRLFLASALFSSSHIHAQLLSLPEISIDQESGEVSVSFEGEVSSYYVLKGSNNLEDFPFGEAIILGANGSLDLKTQIDRSRRKFFYRLDGIPLDQPQDQDGDQIDDVFELNNAGVLDPLRSIDAFFDSDTDGVNNVTEILNGTNFLVPDTGTFSAAMVTETAPYQGEEMVSTTRQIVVRFSDRIDRTTVTENNFKVEANGMIIPGRREVSATEKFMTFFLEAPLSPSTEVRVTVDGNSIMSRSGEALDADSDGTAGGVLKVDYQTLPLRVIPGTNLFGFVYDSMRKTPGGDPLPLQGVTIRLDALPILAVTDETGRFELQGVPAPEFFAKIDGSTVPNPPAGRQYPVIGKAFHSTPGQTTQINKRGVPFDIFLPAMSSDDITTLSMIGPTEVTFGSGALADLAEILPDTDPTLFEEMMLMVPPGSAKSDDGEFADQVSIIAVPPDRTPGPLPPMAEPPAVISIQAGRDGNFNGAEGGTSNFDIPVPFSFPNLEGAAPGTKQSVFSFDHDAGNWVYAGLGTVSDDGRRIVADEGVGIIAPGWHFPDPWTRFRRDRPRPPRRSPRPPRPPRPGNPPINPPPPNTPPPSPNPPGPGNDAPGPPPGPGSPGSPGNPGSTPGTPGGLPDGDDCYFLVVVIADGQEARRLITDRRGLFYCYLTPNTAYTVIVYDPKTGRVWRTTGTSGAAGTPTDFGDYNFGDPDPADTNGNGVPDVIDQVLGEGLQFDFGTAGSPLAPAHTRVMADSDYSAGTGFGWIDGSINALDRSASSSSLLRDFCTATNGSTFAVDLPAGLYDVTVFLGDETQDRTRQEISLEGQLRVNASTVAGEFFTSRHRIFIEDGQLTVDFDGSGSPALCGLHITVVNNSEQIFTDFPNINPEGLYYIAIEDLESGFILRNQVDLSPGEDLCGGGVDLSPDTPHRQIVYHVDSGWIGVSHFTTSAIGRPGNLPEITLLPPTNSPDSDGDGLPDIGEFAVGTNANDRDTDDDGINDLLDIIPPNNPLDDRSFPTGLISQLGLMGEGRDILIDGDLGQASQLTAYVATGSHGLAIVDVSQLDNPIVLGQLELEGTATRVATAQALGFAAVACEGEGVHLIDIADPMAPALVRTIPMTANAVCYYNGNLYVGTDEGIASFAISRSSMGLNAQALETLSTSAVVDFAREHQFLYVMSNDRILRIIDLSSFAMLSRGQLTLQNGGGRIFAGGGMVYAVAAQPFRGGYMTVDVMDPDSPSLISDTDVVAPFIFPRVDIALSGSGAGLLVGTAGTQDVSVINASDPEVTNSLLIAFDDNTTPQAAAIASGFGFVASNTGGLSVYNYLPFDTNGQAPVVAIDTTSLDIDPGTDGLQIQEGTVTPIIAEISDDVQIRSARFFVDGAPVATDVSFPFDFFLQAPALTAGANTVNIQIEATDTGGNVTLSDPLTVNLVPDTIAPTVVNLTPADGVTRGQNFTTVRAEFSEPMDETTLTAGNLQVLDSTNTPVNPESVDILSFGQRLQLTFVGFTPGDYQLRLDEAALTDVAGNAIGTGERNLSFTILEADAVFAAAEGGFWDVATNWDSGIVPGPLDDVFLSLPNDATVTIRSGTIRANTLTGTSPVVITGGTLEVADFIQLDAPLTLDGGTLRGARVLPGAAGECLNFAGNSRNVLDGVTLDCNVTMDANNAHFGIDNGLTLNGVITMANRSSISFIGDETINGDGEIFFNSENTSSKNLEAQIHDTTLTIGENLTISGSRGRLSGSLFYGRRASIINNGLIVANSSSGELLIRRNGGSFMNNGILRVENGATLAIENLTGNLNAVELLSEGTLNIQDGSYEVDQAVTINASNQSLILGGEWQNTGGLTLNNGNLTIGGPKILSDLGPITRTGGTVTFSGDLDLEGGTLALNDATGSWRIFDGAIRNGTITGENSGTLVFAGRRDNVLDAITLDLDLALTEQSAHFQFDNGLTLNGTVTMSSRSSISFIGDEMLGGTGTILFDSSNNNSKVIEASQDNTTLTIGADLTVRGSRGTLGGSLWFGRNSNYVNNGTLTAESSNGALLVRARGNNGFVNGGSLNATSEGSLQIENLRGNLGGVDIDAESTLEVQTGNYNIDQALVIDADNANAILRGSWTNINGITLSNGNLTIGGPKILSDLGPITRTGGTVTFSGDLDLEGGTLALNDATGSWRIFDGAIRNGTITGENSGTLAFAGRRDNVLDAITLDLDLALTEQSAHFQFDNGLTLNGTVTMSSRSSISFIGDEMLDGTGTILFDPSNNNSKVIEASQDNTTLTIGADLTIRGSRGTLGGSLWFGRNSNYVNNGALTAESDNGVFFVRAFGSNGFTNNGILNVINQGTMQIENLQGNLGTANISMDGTLEILSGNYVINQAITINGANVNVNFGGTWQNTGGINLIAGNFTISGSRTLADLGTITRTGGTITFSGDLDLEGGTLALNDMTGSWRIFDGAIRNGTITGENSGTLVFAGRRNNVLDAITLDLDLALTEQSAHFQFDNGLTLNGAVTMSSRSSISFIGDEMLGGTGTILFDSSNNNSKVIEASQDNTTLTIGADLTVRGSRGTIGGSLWFGRNSNYVNSGTLMAESSNGALLVRARGNNGFVNNGPLNAISQGTLQIENLQGNLGSTNIAADSSIDIQSGNYTIDQAVTLDQVGSAASFNGAWQNTGGITLADGFLTLDGARVLGDFGAITRTGGTVIFSGDLDLEGGTLALNDTTGPWRIFDGAIRNGTITGENSGTLVFAGRRDNVLDAITLDLDLALTEQSAHFQFDNGLTLNGTVTMSSRSSISFIGDEMLGGTGTILFDSSNNNSKVIEASQDNTTLTIGADLTIRGSRGTLGGSLWFGRNSNYVNNGTLMAESSNSTLLVRARGNNGFANNNILTVATEGTMIIENLQGNLGSASIAADGSLDIQSGNYIINQIITLDQAGSSANFDGTWINTGDLTQSDGTLTLGGNHTLASLGTITRSGGTLNFSGDLDLENQTFTLDDTLGTWRLLDGIIRNGTFANTGTNVLRAASRRDNALVKMTVDGNILLDEGSSHIQIDDGLTLNGCIDMNSRSSLSFLGDETISGSGTIAFGGNTGQKEFEMAENNTTLTIGDGITITGQRARLIGTLYFGRTGSLINRGSIIADGGTIRIETRGGTFSNDGPGTTSEINGGTITIDNPAP